MRFFGLNLKSSKCHTPLLLFEEMAYELEKRFSHRHVQRIVDQCFERSDGSISYKPDVEQLRAGVEAAVAAEGIAQWIFTASERIAMHGPAGCNGSNSQCRSRAGTVLQNMLSVLIALAESLRACFCRRVDPESEILALCHQLAVLQQAN